MEKEAGGSRRKLTWYCRALCHFLKCEATCCRWWHHGSWPPSHWQRTNLVSKWSPASMGLSPENHQGTRYKPAVNHSTVVSEKYSLGSPTETPCIRVTSCPLWHIFPSLFCLIRCMQCWYLSKPSCVYLGQNKPLNSIRSGNRGEKERRLDQTRTLMERVELVELLFHLIILGGNNTNSIWFCCRKR